MEPSLLDLLLNSASILVVFSTLRMLITEHMYLFCSHYYLNSYDFNLTYLPASIRAHPSSLAFGFRISASSFPPPSSQVPHQQSYKDSSLAEIIQTPTRMKQGCMINGKQIRHKWTTDDRIVLGLLYKLYDNSDVHRLAIFNRVNKDIFSSEGFPPTGYPHNGMIKQKYDLERSGVGSDVWGKVMSMSPSKASQAFAIHVDSIKGAAADLRIRLRLRAGSPSTAVIPVKNHTLMTAPTSKAAASRPLQPLATAHACDWEESSSEDEDLDQDSPCSRRQKTFDSKLIQSFTYDVRTATPVVSPPPVEASDKQVAGTPEKSGRPTERPLLRIRDHSDPDSPRSFPALLFRAFDPTHGFRARKFLFKTNKVPPPPPFASETFREKVEPHLSKYLGNMLGEHATYMSPFLSLAENPVRALNRISNSDQPLSFAIFHTPEMTKDAKARYSRICMPMPYLVPTIVSTHDLDDLPGGYTGRGEWLAWGSIECRPVAVFDSDEALELLRAMPQIKKIDECSGPVVAQYLERIADKYKELVAYKLLRAFQVPGFQGCPISKHYNRFIEAMYDATRGDRAASIFSEDMVTPRKTRIVVEVPVYRQTRTEKGKEKPADSEIDWQVVEDEDSGRQISVGLALSGTDSTDAPLSLPAEELDDLQDLIDAQLRSDGVPCGIGASRPSPTPSYCDMPPSLFVRELQEQALIPTPPPVPPVEYSPSPVEHKTVASTCFGTTIIDLCDENEQDEEDDEIHELPTFDLTQDDESHHEDHDCAIIGSATLGRGGHSALTIRSRSLSNAINTPTRPPKRGRGGMMNTR